MEIWKEYFGDRHIWVSNYGNVLGARKKPIKLFTNSSGYLYASYSIPIHKIVALLFIDNPESKEFVNHKDGNKQNNNADNLE